MKNYLNLMILVPWTPKYKIDKSFSSSSCCVYVLLRATVIADIVAFLSSRTSVLTCVMLTVFIRYVVML